MSGTLRFIGPDGPEVHAFDVDDLWNHEVEKVQRVTGMRFKQFAQALDDIDATAWTAVVQLLWARQGRDVKIGDVRFKLTSVAYEADDVADDGSGQPDDIPLPPNG